MLETIILILVLMWLAGLIMGPPVAIGSLIHLLLVVAIVILLIRLIRGRPIDPL